MQKSSRRLSLVVLLPLLVGTSGSDPPCQAGANERGWKLVSDRHGIQVYRRDREGLRAFRGITRFRLNDEYALAALLRDYDTYPDWLHFVTGVRELDSGNNGARRLRFITRLPWPLANREAVLESRVTQSRAPRPEQVVVAFASRPGLLPPDPDYLRVTRLRGGLRFRRLGAGQVEVIYELSLDPGGRVPRWFADALLRDAPHFTLDRLREAVRQPRYQGHYYSELDLRGPGRPGARESLTKPR